jgi:tetratricopeptide (TPR) repeat protein
MQIYQLALQDTPIDDAEGAEEGERMPPSGNLLARGVTYRDMGTIFEQWGKEDEALNMYHRSLECITEWKACVGSSVTSPTSSPTGVDSIDLAAVNEASYSLKDLQLSKSSLFNLADSEIGIMDENAEKGEMELFFGKSGKSKKPKVPVVPSRYDVYFPPHLDELNETRIARKDKSRNVAVPESRYTYADVDLAVTLHQIAQLHRNMGRYPKALEAYQIALRGMKYALGRLHPNVAAILGNIGNLQKEMGDLDAAYDTYQEVLGIESYRLGLSHPEVTISLHNIATIEAARGNYDHALAIYRKVLSLQRKLFGEDHSSVAVTAACMGDVYEKLGDVKNGVESYEEALRIKTVTQGRHHIEVARLLAKLGKMALSKLDLNLADSYVSRAVLIYRLNKLPDFHEWLVDAYRDAADIDAAIAMGRGKNAP